MLHDLKQKKSAVVKDAWEIQFSPSDKYAEGRSYELYPPNTPQKAKPRLNLFFFSWCTTHSLGDVYSITVDQTLLWGRGPLLPCVVYGLTDLISLFVLNISQISPHVSVFTQCLSSH